MTPSERKEKLWLRDMLEAIEKIQSHPKFVEGASAFESDEHFRVWVLYHMERIGECASRLRREHDFDTRYPAVDWQGAQGLRRKIVHTYWDTDFGKVWAGVEYLDTMKKLLSEILDEKTEPT